MAKEPAGLRRWRLAHKRKRRARRVKAVRSVRRRRYGRKGKRSRGSKAVPVIQTMMVGYPILMRFMSEGLTVNAATGSLFDLTGYDASQKKFTDPKRGIGLGVGLLIVSTLGAKIANKSGANRILKKMSAGMLKFA